MASSSAAFARVTARGTPLTAPAARSRARALRKSRAPLTVAPRAAVVAPAVSWPDGTGRAEDGAIVAEASVVNLGKRGEIATGLPFLDHMIDQLTSHCQLGVSVVVTKDGTPCVPCVDTSGDDDEAVAVAAGSALGAALAQMLAPGIEAVASGSIGSEAASATFASPLDEAYSTCVLSLTDAGSLAFSLAPYGPGAGRTHIGKYQTSLTEPFWRAVVEASGLSVSLTKERGDNAHHIVEATFKSFARCLRKCMDQVEGIDVAASDERLEGVTRAAGKARSTKETTIDVKLDLDGAAGKSSVSTGIQTLDELLGSIAHEGGVQLNVDATGDLWIDDHHTTEDVAITVGQVLNESLGDKAGCNRMGRAAAGVLDGVDSDSADAAMVEVVMDLSNRPFLSNGLVFRDEFIGDLSAEMVDHLFMSIAANGQMTVHVVEHRKGKSDADLASASARAFGRCLRQCIAVDPRRAGQVASSKGTLSV